MDHHHGSDSFANSWVHIGPWMNWSKSPLSILTFTTTHKAGLILNSCLTLFITICAGFCWCMLCYVVHQYRSSPDHEDGIHHQSQAIIRNSQTDGATLWQLLKLGYAWHRKAEKTSTRIMRLTAVALLHLAIFEAAAILASRIYDSNPEVLIRSNLCGYIPDAYANNDEVLRVYEMNERLTALWSLDYSRNCYNQGGNIGCNVFATSALNKTAEIYTNQECPFDNSLCMDPDSGAIKVDSGYIDSNVDLGLNSRKSKSVKYKRVTTCAPLRTSGLTKSAPGVFDQQEWLEFNFGPTLDITSGGVESVPYTWTRNLVDRNVTNRPYGLSAKNAMLGNSSDSNFAPIQALNRTDGDVTLMFVDLDAWYPEPVQDALYQATTLWTNPSTGEPYYISDNPVGVLGCVEQHQFCQAYGDQMCTALTGFDIAGLPIIFDDGEQTQIVQQLYSAIYTNQLWHMAGDLSGQALLAQLFQIFGTQRISKQLPPEMWQREVVGWHQFIMARMQRIIVGVATGPLLDQADGFTANEYKNYLEPMPESDTMYYDVCNNVKVTDSNYYSWNLVGVLAIVVVGLAIIVTAFCIEYIGAFIQKQIIKRWRHKADDWQQDHVLHLQRHGFERSEGHVTWNGHEKSIPTTERNEKFASLSRHSVTSPSAIYPKGGAATVVETSVSPSMTSPGLQSPRSMGSNSGYFAGAQWQSPV